MSGETSVLVGSGQGRVLRAFGEEITILLESEQTGGRLTMWLEKTPPGGGPPLHFHINDDETFHVLEGRAMFFQNSQWHELGPGGSAFVPRGEVHTFKNAGEEVLRMIMCTSPGGFDRFFTRCAEEWNKNGGPDINRIHQIAAEHGIHFLKQESP